MSSFCVSLLMQLLKDTAPTQVHQIPRIGSISALLPTAPAATHGRSLVVHKSNKWVKSLVAALEQLPASSGRTNCGLCRCNVTIAPVPAMPSVSHRSRSWNSGTSFFSDAVMQDSWWRLIVYFDVIGMVATRGAPFDSFFSSEHAAAFSAVIQVRAGHFHRHHAQHHQRLAGGPL